MLLPQLSCDAEQLPQWQLFQVRHAEPRGKVDE
ncbi:hypothetical protein JOE25_002013 [Serratia sp. PL17]|nr:hypothetical protein [Serratia sp. PL17]